MNYILDIIFLAVFLLMVILSAKKGFFKTLFELSAYVISVIAAKLFSQTLSPGIYSGYFSSPLENSVTNALGDVSRADLSKELENLLNSIPESLGGIMELIGINREELISGVADKKLTGERLVDFIMGKVVEPVSTAVIRTVLFVLIAFLLSVFFRIIIRLFDKKIDDIPAIKQVDSGLGVVLGIIKGAVIVFLLALIAGVAAGFIRDGAFVDKVNSSIVVNSIRGFLNSISGYTG